MAATELATSDFPAGAASIPAPAARPEPARAEIARLAALHREAEQTARLANLVGRAPYVAAVLAIASAFAAGLALPAAQGAAIAAWLVLVFVAVGAIARAYRQAILAPFERAPLAGFAQDLPAILTYAGFAWGAGAFLILPAATDPLAALAFAVVPPALAAGLLRYWTASLPFLAAAASLSAFAMVLRPLPDGALGAAVTLIAAAAVAGAAFGVEKWQAQAKSLPALAELPFG
jgi:hypothetical protein